MIRSSARREIQVEYGTKEHCFDLWRCFNVDVITPFSQKSRRKKARATLDPHDRTRRRLEP